MRNFSRAWIPNRFRVDQRSWEEIFTILSRPLEISSGSNLKCEIRGWSLSPSNEISSTALGGVGNIVEHHGSTRATRRADEILGQLW